MTEEESLEYRNSYSGFLNSIKEIYQSMESNLTSHLNFCKFAPDIDDETLRDAMNNYAKNEEPLAILCVGDAKGSAGFFASITGKSYSEFLFTTQLLYLKSHALKLSEINSIDYKEETKTSLFGKAKIESSLVVTKTPGAAETFKGGIATQAIAEFLNAIVKAFKENPPEEIPAKEYPRSKLIVNTLNDLKIPSFNSGFNHEAVNFIIIKFGKDELKDSFAANYNRELYLSNDNLYLTSNNDYKRIPYTDLLKAVYKKEEKFDSDGEIETAYETSLYDKNNEIVFATSDESVNQDEKLADFFNMIISDATGAEVKTEKQITELPPATKIIQEFIKKIKPHAYTSTTDITHLVTDGCIFDFEAFGLYIAFGIDSLWISKCGNSESIKLFKYNSISKACLNLDDKNDKYVSLNLYDSDGHRCFYENPSKFIENWDLFAKEIADVINEIVSELSGKQVETECIDTRPLEQLIQLKGDVVSDSKEERDHWNSLLNKWNDIFSKDSTIEFRRLTESEKKKLPRWTRDKLDVSHSNVYTERSFKDDDYRYSEIKKESLEREKALEFYREYDDYFYYFMGNAILILNGSSKRIEYFPDAFSTEDIKYLKFAYDCDIEYRHRLVYFNAASTKGAVVSWGDCMRPEGYHEYKDFVRDDGFYQYYDDRRNDEAKFKFLAGEDFVKNYNSFIERLANAKKEGLQKAKNATDVIGKEKQAEQQNLMNDLNNW